MALAVACLTGALAVFARARCLARPARYGNVALAWSAAVYLCMLLQEYALYRDGLLTMRTGLPLHLCGFSGFFLCAPMLLCKRGAMYDFFLCLSAPAAALALCFPAIARTSAPLLTELSFFFLHALLLFAPVVKGGDGELRVRDTAVGGVTAIACLLLLSAFVANSALSANYLFLASPPPGTPLAALSGLSIPARAAVYLALAPLSAYTLHVLRIAKERMHHEKKDRYSDKRGRLPGAERGDPGRGAGGV